MSLFNGAVMWAYVQNIAYALITMAGFALAGGVAIIPFRKDVRYALLLAPLFGLLLTTLGALAGYVLFRMPMRTAGISSLLFCCCATLVGIVLLKPQVDWKKTAVSAVAVTCITTVQTTLFSAISIEAGACAIAYMDGTDHLGYAQAADWLRSQRLPSLTDYLAEVDQGPDGRGAYESWPLVLRMLDPRFGSFTFLSLISIFSHRSGMFAYDLACAIGLSAAVLALSGLFARNRITLLLLLLSLMTCHWFDYTRCGFFAKSIAFPASFLTVGLFFLSIRHSENRFVPLILTLLSASAGLMQSGVVTAFFLVVFAGTFILADILTSSGPLRSRVNSHWGSVLYLLALGSTTLLASGTLARPLHTEFPRADFPWTYIFDRISELESQNAALSGLTNMQITLGVWICLILWIILIVIAVHRRCSEGLAMLAGPFVLLVILRLVNAKAATFQMIGVFYPLAMCGAALITVPRNRERVATAVGTSPASFLVCGIMALALSIHLPRFIGAFARYCGPKTPLTLVFTKPQLEQVARIVGRDPVYVDGSSPQAILAVLVELGRRRIPLQWSPTAWKLAFGYRKWPLPSYGLRAKYCLVAREFLPPAHYAEVFETNQLRLFKVAQPGYSN
jgi:hypothetical protein